MKTRKYNKNDEKIKMKEKQTSNEQMLKEIKDIRVSADDSFSSYQDPYQTEEQLKRDSTITKLLTEYYEAYVRKGKMRMYLQQGIWGLCAVFVMGSIIALLFLTQKVVFHSDELSDLNAIVGFVTAFVSFAGLVFGLMTIITRFAFPENDEQYITDIVKAIQDNDYKTVVESHKNMSKGDSPKKAMMGLDVKTIDDEMGL